MNLNKKIKRIKTKKQEEEEEAKERRKYAEEISFSLFAKFLSAISFGCQRACMVLAWMILVQFTVPLNHNTLRRSQIFGHSFGHIHQFIISENNFRQVFLSINPMKKRAASSSQIMMKLFHNNEYVDMHKCIEEAFV